MKRQATSPLLCHEEEEEEETREEEAGMATTGATVEDEAIQKQGTKAEAETSSGTRPQKVGRR